MLIGEIHSPVTDISGVGSAAAAQLKKLGVQTVGDLLKLFPRNWEDRSVFHSFAERKKFQKINVLAKVAAHEWFGFGKMKTLKILAKDESGFIASLLCFNRNFLQNVYPVGSRISVYGSFYDKYNEIQSSSFEIEKAENAQSKILPVYPLTSGLGQGKLRKFIQTALKQYGTRIDNDLPAEVLLEYNLPSKSEVLFYMHEPKTMRETEIGSYALIFEELFLFQYAALSRALERRGKLPSQSIEEAEHTLISGDENILQDKKKTPQFSPLQKELCARLPFELTDDQLTTIAEINADLCGKNSMARLVQGDVGSGKTLTAFFACLRIIEDGAQTAFLAPTELLARQHAENAAKLLEPAGVRLAFLTGNIKAKGRSALLRELAEGNIDLVIGTHALFSSNVKYKNLKLAVIDEQHRFGVLQRAAIIQKGIESSKDGKPPHLLMMSATPIPRTLALSIFGDLDISTIKTKPLGRKPIITYVAGSGSSGRVYHFVGTEILKGRQAYFVYPIIDETETFSLKSAEQMFSELKEGFPNHRVELIHSKTPEDGQKRIMEEFKCGNVNILVATSIVEVGVDVPNASCMVIEHAERFGLSALHQLRGRVGRGGEQSYCILIYGKNLTENGRRRLEIMKETDDGFIIAEEDLKLRGPGDIGGLEQSGYLGFKMADPIRDKEILLKARAAAFKLLEKSTANSPS